MKKKETSKLLAPKKAAISHLGHLSPEQREEDEAFAKRRYSPSRTRASKVSQQTTTKSTG